MKKPQSSIFLAFSILISILIWQNRNVLPGFTLSVRSRFCAILCKGELKQSETALKPEHRSKPSYIGAITAEESLLLAVASDLRTYLHFKGRTSPKLLNEIHTATFNLYRASVRPTENEGWLLQPGQWKDHPDYLYAGYSSVPTLAVCASSNSQDPHCELKPRPVNGIGMDVSHFLSKWTVFLIAYRDASYDNQSRQVFFEKLISGLEAQLFNHVIKPQRTRPPYLLTNYMDGTNGVFRWNYVGRGKNWGYNAFYLSSTPCYSSIALLNSDRVRNFYKQIYNALPYTAAEIKMMGGKKMDGDVCNRDEARLMISLSSKLLGNPQSRRLSISNLESQLFAKTFVPALLSKDSWIGENAYQGVVGQRQIVLHSAFFARKQDWIDTFTTHFSQFIEGVKSNGWSNTSEYYKWHQLLFASRYLVLSAQLNLDSPMHTALYQYLYQEVAHAWEGINPPVSNYGWGEPRFTNYRDWVQWKTELAE